MGHKNNFGFLRLLLASLVIFSHSPEILDGNRSREILTQVFGTISFGELALDGFFLISGYLILKSFETSSSLKSYLFKRVLRIFPGFIVAALLCIFVFAPMLGEVNLPFTELAKMSVKLLMLEAPMFDSLPIAVNGSLWTIWVEFLCYLSIPVFFYLGLYRRPYLRFLMFVLMVGIYLYTQVTQKNMWLPYPLRIDFHHSTRLLSAFMVGGFFYTYRDKIVWNKTWTTISLVAFIALMFNNIFAELGLFIFGGYLLFNFALNYQNPLLNRVGAKTDISYGVYLYAWPIQALIAKHNPEMLPYQLSMLALLGASMLGYLSWIIVEKPFLQLKSMAK